MSLRFPRLCLAGLLATALAARAQTPPAGAVPANNASTLASLGDNEPTTLKLPDADIDSVLGALEQYTGRNILRPASLTTSTYNIMITRPLPKSDVIRAIETVLELNGIAVVPIDDKFMKVVQLATVRTEAPELITGSTLGLPPSGRIATKIFALDFLRVNEFIPQVQVSMLSQGVGAGVVLLQNANAALITDTISNLQRIETLLQEVDKPITSSLKPKFYQLHNGAKASDLVAKIHTFISPTLQTQLGTATTFNADDRTNQIVLIADPRQHAFFDDLIAKLDVKADPNTRNEVIYLKSADATILAQVLSQIVSGQTTAAQRANSQSVRPGQGIQAGNATLNGSAVPPPGANAPAGNAGAIPGLVAPAPTVASLLGGNGAAGEASSSNQFSSLITIAPDERSNSIIVSGTVDDIRLVRELIDKLDILLAQVSIEVVIAEVTLTDTDTSGISALNLTIGTDAPGNAATSGDNGRGTHITNFAGSLAGWDVSSGIVNPLSFVAALNNAGSKNTVKVIQANTITTTHNKQATFQVTENQPIVTGVTSTANTSATNGVTTQSNVTYQPIGITVKVTPLIGDDGSIQLTIDQIVDDVVGTTTIDNNSQPIIGHREANSFVNVADGQMVVLGGLQSNKRSLTRNKLGFIYEIPILSNFLGGRQNETDRTELLFFIRPRVIKAEERTKDTNRHIDELSSKDQINQFLADPSKPPKESLIDKIK